MKNALVWGRPKGERQHTQTTDIIRSLLPWTFWMRSWVSQSGRLDDRGPDEYALRCDRRSLFSVLPLSRYGRTRSANWISSSCSLLGTTTVASPYLYAVLLAATPMARPDLPTSSVADWDERNNYFGERMRLSLY